MSTPPNTASSTDRPGALLRALRYLLRPLVRLLIAEGITYPDLLLHLKSI